MRSLLFPVWLVSLLLCSCHGPKVTTVVNRLKPGMLEGKTVGVEGMIITAACWPGMYIEAPVLSEAEHKLQHRFKKARVRVITESGTMLQDMRPGHGSGADSHQGKAISSASGQPDYIFKIMLREDSTTHEVNQWRGGVITHRMRSYRAPAFPAFGGWSGFTGDFSYPNREVTKRTLRAEYTLSDNKTCQILWRAEAVSSDTYVELDGSWSTYRNVGTVEREVPFYPLFAVMNSAALKAIP